jgi:galactarate dehydratase
MSKSPLYIRISDQDNVAIIANSGGVAAGTTFAEGLALRERVPQGHKVSLADIPKGAPIFRYGEVIGTAAEAIPRGSWVSEARVCMPEPPQLDNLPLATKPPPVAEPLEGFTFEGYANDDGTVGTRNLLGISTSVQCVAGVVEFAVKRIREEILPRYPNVDGVVPLIHTYGCGVAIKAPGAAVPLRTIRNVARNPNFGGAPMVVGLGCEKLIPEWLLSERGPDRPRGIVNEYGDIGVVGPAPALGNTSDVVRLQDESHHSFGDMVASIMEMAEKRLAVLDRRTRTTRPASDLVVGFQCGGSDAFSGVTANPAVGFASDLLVRAGATAMFSEVTEVRDAIHLLTARAINEDVARALVREMVWYDNYLAMGGADRSANTTPGNKQGGLVNIVEKCLGSVAKSGTAPISAVVSPGERAQDKGLLFAATPAGDFVCGTLQLAAGMNVHVFTTGRGTPYGLAAVPVIKMSTRDELKERWGDLIDISAGRIATGQATIPEIGWELFHLILDVASGRRTWAEHWGIHNTLTLFNPGPVT